MFKKVLLSAVLIIALFVMCNAGRRRSTTTTRTTTESDDESEDYDSTEESAEHTTEADDETEESTEIDDGDSATEKPKQDARESVLCDASDIPVDIIFKWTEFIEDFHEGKSSADEVKANMKKIRIYGNSKCNRAFYALKNHSISIMDKDDDDDDTLLMYKTVVRILNQRLGDLLRLQEKTNNLRTPEGIDQVKLLKLEVMFGDVRSAVGRFKYLQERINLTAPVAVNLMYDVKYLDETLSFLEVLKPPEKKDGCLELFTLVAKDKRLDLEAATIFDEYLNAFSEKRDGFVYLGMSSELKKILQSLNHERMDNVALIATEIQRGDLEASLEKYYRFSEPNITAIVGRLYLEKEVGRLISFLDNLDADVVLRGCIALLELFDKDDSPIPADKKLFIDFVSKRAIIASDNIFKLIYQGIIYNIEKLHNSESRTSVRLKPHSSLLLVSRKRHLRSPHHELPLSRKMALPPNYTPPSNCFQFSGNGSRLEGRLLPQTNQRSVSLLRFHFKTAKPNGLLAAVNNQPYNFGIFLDEGLVCVSSRGAVMCTSPRAKFTDSDWHVARVHYTEGGGVLQAQVDSTSLYSSSQIKAVDKNVAIKKKRKNTNDFFIGSLPRNNLNSFFGLYEVADFEGAIKELSVNKIPLVIQMYAGASRCKDSPRTSNYY